VLVAVAAALRRAVRTGDVAARIGGDEFAVVLPDLAPGAAGPVFERLAEAVRTAVPEAPVTLSTGLAQAPEEADDVVALYRLADQRLYAGRGR
jgi:diguanylate cyclase (GGDEF)-like protein